MKNPTDILAGGLSTKSSITLMRNPNPNKQTTQTWRMKQTTWMN